MVIMFAEIMLLFLMEQDEMLFKGPLVVATVSVGW